uniref:Reverse transcriptase domain-containing protein n=1 Tax=Cajanus cajan TaxID=3821 RepID=A0A151RBM2_CAJCA|nr:hypothetical protein KK1_038744 [Cajanus cajan]
MKGDIFHFMKEFHTNGKLPRGTNTTFIILIPKKEDPQHLGNYRPISLVGCMYKILSKILANRFKRMLPISMLVNESPTKEFCLKRGLRQRDPLAPFLFSIVVERLTGMIREVEKKNLFRGLKVGNDQVDISIVQYADDTVFLGKASLENVVVIKSILQCFEVVSRLKVNFFKSYFGATGVDRNLVESFAHLLNRKLLQLPFTYLGLPIGANPRRIETWKPIL